MSKPKERAHSRAFAELCLTFAGTASLKARRDKQRLGEAKEKLKASFGLSREGTEAPKPELENPEESRCV